MPYVCDDGKKVSSTIMFYTFDDYGGSSFGYESASLASLVSKSRNNLHQPPPLALYRRQSFCEDALDIPKS